MFNWKFIIWVCVSALAIIIVAVFVARFGGQANAPAFSTSLAPSASVATGTTTASVSGTVDSIAVPTTPAMQFTDASQATVQGTLVSDPSSTAVSADGAFTAVLQYLKEYPLTYSFNDGNGPDLIVDDFYLLVTNAKTGQEKEIGVVDLAPSQMITAAKFATTTAQYALIAQNLAWTSADQLTGKIVLYDAANVNNLRQLQAAQFTVDPATWAIKDVNVQ